MTVLIERYCVEQSQWKPQSRDDIRGDLLQIAAIAGDPVSTDLSRPKLSQVQSTLLKLPANLNKRPKYGGKTYDQIIALGDPPQSASNVSKKWGRLTSFLKWAHAHGSVHENFAAGMKPKAKSQSYEKFTERDLRLLFETPHFRGGADEAFKYWIPTLGLFTGARIEELCQLHLADIHDTHDVPYLEITEAIDSETGAVRHQKSVKGCLLYTSPSPRD